MFGSSTNTPFGSSTGASFGTGTSTTFGSSLFGGSTNRDNGLFGSGLLGASGTTLKGTPVKFSIVQGNDSMVKNGITTNISVRHQCITVMSTYDKKSIEELRIEDYEAGRKKEIFSICTSSGSLFGNTSGSGCSSSSSLTGPQSTTGFGVAGSGFAHGSPAPTATPVAPGFISVGSLATNGTSLSGSMFGIPNTQVGGFTFGSAPSQSFTLGARKTTASATVNPTTAFTLGGATTPASSASLGFTLGNGSVGGNPTSGLNLGAAPVTTITGGLSLGGGFKLGGIAASPANAGTTGTSTAPGFSFPPTSGVKLGTTQTTSLPTGTTTGSLFGSSFKTAGLFGQQQTTEGLGQKAGSLFGTPTSTGTRFGSGFCTSTSIFGQTSCGQTLRLYCC